MKNLLTEFGLLLVAICIIALDVFSGCEPQYDESVIFSDSDSTSRIEFVEYKRRNTFFDGVAIIKVDSIEYIHIYNAGIVRHDTTK